jgi:cysteinyl-tRNA synthetase
MRSMLEIHNSLTGRKEPLRELEPGHVRMYVCGITVYDYCHVGHARSLIVFDVVRRYLRYRGYRVTHVRNITDIDDKIIARAAENGEPVAALTERFIAALHEDCVALGVETPEHEPRATEYVAEIVAMIEALLARGYAYVADDGDVLYSVSRFDGYGRLSGKKLADLRAGARVEVNEAKHDPLDFVLWKTAKPGEPAWPSPWGAGRPGWHIECSAMSVALLGNHFDLHGGGMDLKFPHHENEIAQSCAASGSAFVNVWMHNGFVNVDAEKMSKSLGNFFTVREVLPRLRPEVLRAFVLASHYRGPVNYTADSLRQAEASLERLYLALRGVPRVPATGGVGAATERFRAAMDDDFNTAEAFAVLQDLARDLNVARAGADGATAARLAAELGSLGAVLGILGADPDAWLKTRPAVGLDGEAATADTSPAGTADAEIDALVAARSGARAARNFQESDRIRDLLLARGVLLEDGPAGTSWRWR